MRGVYPFTARTRMMPGNDLQGPGLDVLTDGDELHLSSPEGASEWVVIVAQFRSFVKNTVEEMGETVNRIQNGTFAN